MTANSIYAMCLVKLLKTAIGVGPSHIFHHNHNFDRLSEKTEIVDFQVHG